MATIYHDSDADLSALAGQTVAVVGYGNQGRSQALNLRDSGVDVVVGNIRDYALERRRRDGFAVLPIAEACAAATLRDAADPRRGDARGLRASRSRRTSRRATWSSFASGYNVAFGLIEPAADLDVVLVAPRMIGVGVRDAYRRGRGFPALRRRAPGRDAAPRARACSRSSKGIGSTRGGCIEMSMHDEASPRSLHRAGLRPGLRPRDDERGRAAGRSGLSARGGARRALPLGRVRLLRSRRSARWA